MVVVTILIGTVLRSGPVRSGLLTEIVQLDYDIRRTRRCGGTSTVMVRNVAAMSKGRRRQSVSGGPTPSDSSPPPPDETILSHSLPPLPDGSMPLHKSNLRHLQVGQPLVALAIYFAAIRRDGIFARWPLCQRRTSRCLCTRHRRLDLITVRQSRMACWT
jgi:hypothetical protein